MVQVTKQLYPFVLEKRFDALTPGSHSINRVHSQTPPEKGSSSIAFKKCAKSNKLFHCNQNQINALSRIIKVALIWLIPKMSEIAVMQWKSRYLKICTSYKYLQVKKTQNAIKVFWKEMSGNVCDNNSW